MQQNYMAQLGQGQNYMIAPNMYVQGQGQGMPNGYQQINMNGYNPQNMNGQYRR